VPRFANHAEGDSEEIVPDLGTSDFYARESEDLRDIRIDRRAHWRYTYCFDGTRGHVRRGCALGSCAKLVIRT
jgi:hypothetical protein